jgi:hypothetical protein
MGHLLERPKRLLIVSSIVAAALALSLIVANAPAGAATTKTATASQATQGSTGLAGIQENLQQLERNVAGTVQGLRTLPGCVQAVLNVLGGAPPGGCYP